MRRTGLFSFLMLFAVSGWGQTLTGTILGTVFDQSGLAVPGVEVTIVNTDTNRSRTVTTNASGNYSISPYRLVPSLRSSRSLHGHH